MQVWGIITIITSNGNIEVINNERPNCNDDNEANDDNDGGDERTCKTLGLMTNS